MPLPDYKNSIVNLMSSILGAFGCKSKYTPLRQLRPEQLKKSTNIVVIEVDGLGYEYVRKHCKGSVFHGNLKGRITSVFPSTTAAATAAFQTGVPAQQHGLTGWFMFMKEIGTIAVPLLFKPRSGGKSFEETGLKPEMLFKEKSVFQRIKANSHVVYSQKIINSPCTRGTTKRAKRHGYKSLRDCFSKIRKIILASKKRKYIYSYLMDYDLLCHETGTQSKQTKTHLDKIDRLLRTFLKSIQGTNTTVIISSDHGEIDIPKSKRINLNKHPKLVEMLTMPLSGDSRMSYCYVRPSKTKQFEAYMRKHFSRQIKFYKSETLVKKHWFGLFKPNKKIFDRIGDYALIPKENYAIRDFMPNEKVQFNTGDHGGLSREEMYVPLIVINC